MKPTILVATTTRWFPTARLAMAMAQAGFRVEAVCPAKHPLSKIRISKRAYTYRGLRPLASLAQAIAASAPDFILAGDDLAAAQLYQLHQQELSKGKADSKVSTLIERSLGSRENLPVLFARSKFLRVARERGVRGPKTEVLTGSDDLRRWAADNGFPIVLKADGTTGGEGVAIVYNMQQAETAYRKLAAPPMLARALKRTMVDRDSTLFWPSLRRNRNPVNAQVFVAGREATSAIACWKGSVLASLHFEVIEKAKTSGHATVLRVIENSEMSYAAEEMVRGLNLSGLHGLDFMLGASTGSAHLIEINPRSTQVGHLSLGPGRDLPAALYAAVSGKIVEPAPKITENEIIALFPQEWIRSSSSPYLRSGYHDVPWEEPELVRTCVLERRKQGAWYSAETGAVKLQKETDRGG